MRTIKTKNEQHLVRIANDVLRKFCDLSAMALPRDSASFYEALYERDYLWQPVVDYVEKIGDETLGMIVGMRLETDGYKDTHYIQSVPATQLVDTSIYRKGHKQLVMLAMPVVIAAMYDILHTELVIKEKKLQLSRDTAERSTTRQHLIWPKPAMRNFVMKERMSSR